VHILGIGIATVDIIQSVADFPTEDSKIRALSQRSSRGGNATNTLVVLSQLGHYCSWGGVCVNEPHGQLILQDLASHHVDTRFCRIESQGQVPSSYIIINQRTASRTIIHYRNSPEFTLSDLQRIPLTQFDWLHFDLKGDYAEIARMIPWARHHHPQLPISIEVERIYPDLHNLLGAVTVLFCSREFAQQQGFNAAADLLSVLHHQAPQLIISCTWGKYGAAVIAPDGNLCYSQAFSPPEVVDTLGAGDTFNAGFIHGCSKQLPLAETLRYACQLAGEKCGNIGFDFLTHPMQR
jgi:ketohexokinase